MWCDNFDGDLYKLVPGARDPIASVKDVELVTHGHATDGKLNHPTCWNSDHGLVAFFGFRDPAKPTAYVTDSPIVRCTFEEAVRDLWCHGLIMLVEHQVVWDSFTLNNDMMFLLHDKRGIFRPLTTAERDLIRFRVIDSLVDAVDRLQSVKLRGR